MRPRDTLIEHNKKLSTTPSSPLWRGAAQRRGGQRVQENIATLPHPLSCHCEHSEAIQQVMHARMRDFIMTGSPRSQCSLAMNPSM